MEDQFSAWFFKGVGLVAFWLIGQVLVEWIKSKMRKDVARTSEWNGTERRQTLHIDDQLLKDFLSTYQDHVKTLRDMMESSKAKNDLIIALAKQLEVHTEEETANRTMLRRIHDRVVLGLREENPA